MAIQKTGIPEKKTLTGTFMKKSFDEESSSQFLCVSELHEFLFSAGFLEDAADGKAASSLSDIPECLMFCML